MIFFNDRTDMWLAILIGVVLTMICFSMNKIWILSGLLVAVLYHFIAAYYFNPGTGAMAFLLGFSRVIVGVVIPILTLLTCCSGTSREKDESAGSYAARCAMDSVGKAVFLTGLFFFLRSLVNGDQVRNLRRESYSFEKETEQPRHSNYQGSEQKRDTFQEDTATSSNETPKAKKEAPIDDYDILGVPKTAKYADIKRAYHRKVKENHPDRMAGLGEKYRRMANEECQKINAAFDRIRQRNASNAAWQGAV